MRPVMRAADRKPQAEYDSFVAPAPRERREVLTPDGSRLNVEVHGRTDRPTIVLVHGWTCSIAFWSRQLRDLVKDFRVIAYDQRGHGDSGEPGTAGYAIEGIADDLSAVLAATVPDGEKVVLAGHSMGGMTIVGFASRHQEQLHRQVAGVLITNSGVSELVPRSTLIPMPLPLATKLAPISGQIIKITPPGNGINRATRLLVQYASMSWAATPAEIDFASRIVAACPPKTRAGFGQLFSVLNLDDVVPMLDVPTVVVAGQVDKLTPIWHARKLAEAIPNLVELIEIPRSGHLSPIQSHEVVTAGIRRVADETLGGTADLTAVRSGPIDLEAARSGRVRGIA